MPPKFIPYEVAQMLAETDMSVQFLADQLAVFPIDILNRLTAADSVRAVSVNPHSRGALLPSQKSDT